jgi:hypothetical protein
MKLLHSTTHETLLVCTKHYISVKTTDIYTLSKVVSDGLSLCFIKLLQRSIIEDLTTKHSEQTALYTTFNLLTFPGSHISISLCTVTV